MLTRRNQPGRPLGAGWAIALSLTLFSTFLVSGFFDSLVIQVLGHREVPRAVRALVAAVVAAHVVMLWLPHLAGVVERQGRKVATRSTRLIDRCLLLMLLPVPVWFLVGVANGWQWTYLIGDVYMFAVLPATYFGLRQWRLLAPKRVFKWLFMMMLALAVASTALVLVNNMVLGRTHKMSLDAVLPIIYYLILSPRALPLSALILAVFVIAGIISTKRGTWIGMAYFTGMAMLLSGGVRQWRLAAGGMVLMGGLVLAAVYAAPEQFEHAASSLQVRLLETHEDVFEAEGELGAAGGGRMSEVLGVFDALRARGSVAEWMLGLGFGAEISARGGRTRHHIHSTPAAFLARTGVLGLSLWMLFNVVLLALVWGKLRSAPRGWLRTQWIFWFGLFSYSFLLSVKSLSFWGNALAGVQLAFVVELMRLHDLALLRRRLERRRRLARPARHPQS